jgi:protein phosphatase
MPLRLRAGCCSLQGPYREDNEDHVAIAEWPDAIVCVVADGMGGANAGRLASERGVAVLLTNLDKAGRDRPAGAGVEGALREAFTRANQAVLAMHEPGARAAGSTATLLVWLRGAERVHVAHVGDTRAYHLSGGRLTLLTQDHDVRTALVRNGTLTPEQARTHKIRNVLYRYLGSAEVYEHDPADLVTVPIQAGDRFLLCCDGVYNLIDDAGLATILSDPAAPRRCAEALCQRAIDANSRDNVSAVVIDFD